MRGTAWLRVGFWSACTSDYSFQEEPTNIERKSLPFRSYHSKLIQGLLACVCASGLSLGFAICAGAFAHEQASAQDTQPAKSGSQSGNAPQAQKTAKTSKHNDLRMPSAMGSPYVPLDNWVYEAFDRLIAFDYIDDAIQGMRPWTRLECARLLNEIRTGYYQEEVELPPEAVRLYEALTREFSRELALLDGGSNTAARVESLYSRLTGISNPPLTDGNHFGQTITNDFGRPYQEGFNTVDGFSAWATAGRWIGYVRGEYQHAPSAPAPSDGVRQFIFSRDRVSSVPPATPISTVNRLRLLDAYVAMNFENWQVSFGKQSLWWSSMQSGPLMFSDNADPVNMFRISRVSPLKLPSVLRWLGPIRGEWFLGQFAGHEFVFLDTTGVVGQFGKPLSRQPFLQGQKLSFKPTANLEFSVAATVVFAGGPIPLTWHTFFRSYSIGGLHTETTAAANGDGRSGVDFSYRVPGLRKWITFYGDAFTEDEYSPLSYPRKAAIEGGIYMPRVPGIPKLDLRVEGGTTAPADFPGCVGCFYVNDLYPDGSYANNGNILGSWLGRGGQGERAWSTYWLSPRNKVQFQYRHQKVDGDYLPRGGTLNDGAVKADFLFKPNVAFSGLVQYEKWNYPVIAAGPQSNVTTSIQLTYFPGWRNR